jgi:adenylate kinase
MVVFGRPGSGKSSLAERLGADHGYTLVRTGELLRAAVRRRDYLGERVEAHLAGGNLVPDR